MKRKDVKNTPLYLVIIGAVVAAIGLILAIVFGDEAAGIVLGKILLVIGGLIVAYGVRRMLAINKMNNLKNAPNAFATEAKFEEACATTTVSFGIRFRIGFRRSAQYADPNYFKQIKYTYTDQNGISHTVKSLLSYTPAQVNFLQEKGTFQILCDGEVSAINENLPQD